MDPTDIGLFRLAEQRLAWADRRQQVLAQNVANANTPGYLARDVSPFQSAISPALLQTALVQTAPMHLAAAGQAAGGALLGAAGRPKERGISGNAVAIEDQLGKVADTAGIQELVLNLHHKYQGMMRLALGRG